MLDFKYKDKKLLSSYDLDVHLFEKFGVEVQDIIPIRKVYLLNTNKGSKILKKTEYSINQISFLDEALSYIEAKFDRVLKYCRAANGDFYVTWKSDTYCLLDVAPGTECQFNNIVHLEIASKELGKFHKASVGFTTKNENKNYIGKMITSLKRKQNELKFFKTLLTKYDEVTEFDRIVANEIDDYIEQGEKSISFLEGSAYEELCKDKDKIALCHHDLAYHNILIESDKAYFIDFDYAIVDLKVHDLCNFINKVEKSCLFDIDKAKIVINNYNSENNLTKEELGVLYALLLFPYDFYSICKSYYTRRKNYEEDVFLYKLNRKVNDQFARKEFLKQFYDIYVK